MRSQGRKNLIIGALSVGCLLAIFLMWEVASGSQKGRRVKAVTRPYRATVVKPVFAGAPPPIPHAVKELGRESCLACHENGITLSDREIAVAMPHDYVGQCQQCHLEQKKGAPLFAVNGFRGLPEPRKPIRTNRSAPPVIPHSISMRKNCLACHGPEGYPELATPHPDRANCTQCHLIQTEAD